MHSLESILLFCSKELLKLREGEVILAPTEEL